jgi:Flp pilus assembly protein TadD
MQESIDDLYARWQRNPDVAQTVALCDALRGTKRMDLVEIVGSHAARQLDVNALTAAARMYTHTGRLDDAQQVLIAAGRLAPRDGDVYRYLGEVLLRRGDAERAEKVLERAIQFGAKDGTAGTWLDRARTLLPTQQSSGMMAVAQEIARVANGGEAAPRKRSDSIPDDAETQVRKGSDVKAALAEALRAPVPAPAAGRPAVPGAYSPPASARAEPALPQFGLPTASGMGDVLSPTFGAVTGAYGPPSIEPELFDSTFDAVFGAALADAGVIGVPQTASVALPAPSHASSAAANSPGTSPFSSSAFSGASAAGAAAVSAPPPLPPLGAPPPPALPAPPPELPVNPFLVPPKAPRPVGPNGQAMPEARDVLEALQISGVFEPEGAVRPQVFAWDKPEKGKRRIGSLIALIGLAVAIVGGASGTYYYVKDKRAKAHVEGEALLAKIDADLANSDARLLEPSEQSIARSFDLESRSPHAALTWLHERGLVGLLKGGENVAFEDGTQRAKEVGVE